MDSILLTEDNIVHVACQTHYTVKELEEMLDYWRRNGERPGPIRVPVFGHDVSAAYPMF